MDIPGYQAIKRTIEQVIHVCEYLPLLWKDKHWDYGFLFSLVIFKLNKIQKELEEDDIHKGAARVAKSVRVCKRLLERYHSDKHEDIQKAILERKWGKAIWWIPCKVLHDEAEFEVKGKNGAVIGKRWLFIKAPEEVIKEDNYQAYQLERSVLYQKSAKKGRRDLKVAGKIFLKYHDTWWS